MANVACLSRYHFLRVFQDHCHESPVRYLWRARLEHAARLLMFEPDRQIGDIALASGFETHHSFTRAFGRHLGMPPSALDRAPSTLSDAPETGDFALPETRMPVPERDISIEQMQTVRLAYLRHHGPYVRESEDVRDRVNVLRRWARDTGQADPYTVVFGLLHDNRRVTAAARCHFDLGFAVGPETIEDEIVSIMTIPAGRYARANVKRANQHMLGAWEWMSYDWRIGKTAPYEQRWSFELYHPDENGRIDPLRGIDICLRLSS